MATLPFGFTVALLVLLFNGWRCAATGWSCSNEVEESYVYYYKDYYCYNADSGGVPPIPPIEGQDPLLMDSFASRSDKVQSCAKASMGRGFKYFALFKGGECRSSWDATETYDDYSYVRSTRQYCYTYCYWGCYRRCYSYLIYCGNGYGDGTKMNVYRLSTYDIILWIRVKRQPFSQYNDFFNKSSSVSTNINWIIQSWIKGQIEESKICGINNGTLQFWRPHTSDYLIGHYRFPTSFKNIAYIANKTIGLSRIGSEAEVVVVQQYDGQCYENPYARASTYMSKNLWNPSAYMKQSDYDFYGYAYFYCTTPAVRNYKWEVAWLSPDNSTVGGLSTVSTLKSWLMSARSLNYGVHFVQYTISTPENPHQVGYDYGFIEIIPGPLYVYIEKGYSTVYIEKSDMVVDGSGTYDPDFFEQKGNYTGMNFTWVCYKSGESVDDTASWSLQEVYPDGSTPTIDGSPVTPEQTGGCFDTGPGRLPFNDTVITFDNSLMVTGNTYYISLRVHKGNRVGTYLQGFTIAEPPPAFNISCFSNCASSAVINLRLGLSAHCIDTPVMCGMLLSYRWYMYSKDEKDLPGEWIEDNDFYTNLLTSYSGVTEILLQENFLQVNRVYRITLRVTNEYGAEDYFNYDFRPNTPPQRGTCVMDNYFGHAALDLFQLHCKEWEDYDLPLRYQVTVPKLDGTYIVLSVGENNKTSLRLPVGDQNEAFNLRLEIYIIDSLAAYSKFNISLIVLTPEASDLENELPGLVGDHSELDKIVNEENNELAVQISIGVLSAVDNLKANNETNTNTTHLREGIINAITKLRLNDTESVNQIASVLVEATKKEEDITPTSGFQSLGACENMSAILALEGNNTASTEAVENAGKQIILVTGSVLGGAVLSSSKTGNSTSTEVENMAKESLKAMDNLANVFFGRLLKGAHPTVFHSPHVSMELYRQQAGDPMPPDMEVRGGSFLLPPDLAFENVSGYLDRNVKFSDLDPFIWAKNNKYKTQTPVISLSFTDEHGNPIPVHNTQSEIEINIPVNKNNDSLSQPSHFINPNESMAYHSFNITHEDTAFSIRIEPANETRYIVYLRHGKRPNETHFDYQFLIPDFSSCLPPGDENCTMVSEFMQCVGAVNVSYHAENFTKPGQPTYCGPPKNDSVPAPAPPENGEEKVDFTCPEICSYGNLTYANCSCDDIPDVSFLFPNASIAENIQSCRDFISFSQCPNDTTLCKNSVNLVSCYLLEFERFQQCRAILAAPPKLFYDLYGRCVEDPFKVFFNHSVGRVGKWFAGVQVYIAPIVNVTEEEEEVVEEDDVQSQYWWTVIMNMTEEDAVRKYLEDDIVAVVSARKNKTVTLDRGCWWGWYKCTSVVWYRLRLWKKYRYSKKKKEDEDDDNDGRRKRRSLSLDTTNSDLEIKAKQLCIIVKEKPPPPKIGDRMELVEEPTFINDTSSLYTFDVRLYTCLFWDEDKDEWSTKGCKPGPNSTEENLQCFCNHLTSFGGDLFATPNDIDFDEVFIGFASLGKTGNVGVIIAVGVFFLLYIVGVVFARRADRRDKEQISVSIPVRTRKTGSHVYEIAVYTGMFGSSGTTANVSMIINAEKGETEILPLMDIAGAKNPFSRGSVSSFVAKLPNFLGQLNYVRVWHDNSGPSPSWNLHQIVVRHVATDQKWFFICNRWLAVEKDDGLIEKLIFVADRKQMAGFQNLFYQRASKDIGDGHLWFSVYTRPPNSSFTRVQRLTCCISLLFSSMVANAMFYEVGSQKQGLQITFGPIDLNWTEMMIGIQSSLVILPVNLLIITIFRYTGPKTYKSEANSDSKKKKKFKLPHWFVNIAYTLALLTSLTGAAFTMFYSMIWGKEKSNKWITSVIISLVQDIFFLQPLKVIIVASLLSLLFRKPPEEDRDEVHSDEISDITTNDDAKDVSNLKDKMENPKALMGLYSPPDPMTVALARERRLNVIKMKKIFSQIGLQLFFVFLLSVATYGSRSNDRFWLNKNIKDIFNVKIDKVRDVYTFWWWCENYMLPSLYTTPWYNGKRFDEEKDFFSNKISFIVSLPRLRQVRVKPEPCIAWPANPSLKKWFPRCYDDFSEDNRDDASSGSTLELIDVSPSYIASQSSSSSSSNSSSNSSSSHSSTSNSSSDETFPTIPIACKHTVKYQDSNSLGTLPIVTARNTYRGGGLVADLGYDIQTARKVVASLQEDIWINRRTRIVLLELITFQPSTNLFAFTRYSFESLPSGGILPSYRIEPISFHGSSSAFNSGIFIACYALIVLILLYSIYKEIRELRQMRLKYFKDVWNVIELAFICFTIATIVIFFFKSEYTRRLIEKVQENPYARMSFDYVALWTDIESVFLALIIFLATMKFLRILKFNKHIAIMAKSISISKGPMISYSIVFVVVLVAFAIMGHMVFGRSAYMFSTYTRSLVNIFEMILGKGTNYDELESINRFFGPFFIFFYFFSMTIFLMNFFMAILNDSFTEAREILEQEPTEDSEMSDFIGEYAVSMLKEISDELRAMGGKKQKYFHQTTTYSKEAKERDFFLY